MRVLVTIERGYEDMAPVESWVQEHPSNGAAVKFNEGSLYEGDILTVASEQGVEQYRGVVRAKRIPNDEVEVSE